METKTVSVTINGTGFAGDFTAQVYGMIPHKNGVQIELAGICSGHVENARRFARAHGAMMAWDTMAVPMAGYESSEKNSAFVDVSEYVNARAFETHEMPSPADFGRVFQKN